MGGWETVKELKEGEFRIKSRGGKMFLEKKVKLPKDVTDECHAELYEGPCCGPRKYIRLLHGEVLVGMVPLDKIEIKDGRYELSRQGNYSFRIIRKPE